MGGHNMGEGAFRCSLNLSAYVLADSPMYPSSQISLCAYASILYQFLLYLVLII